MQSIFINKYQLLIVAFMLTVCLCFAQTKPSPPTTPQIPNTEKYIKAIDDKIDKYQQRIINKTEKTLTKLAKWENKIKNLLEKASPEAAQKLFGEGKITFTTLLQQLKKGEQIVNTQRAKYDEYRDKLTTSLQYLDQQKQKIDSKLIQPIQKANKKLNELEEETKKQEAIEAFIKERKKQLINEAVKHIGNSKYLTKINKESYYYIETIKNYKEIFSDKKKAEETALTILNKIPAFKRFVEDNSMLAKLFGSPNSGNAATPIQSLQSRASVNTLIQNTIAAGGPNAQSLIQQNMQNAKAELNKLKDKIAKAGGGNSDEEIPDFKPNMQKTRTFLQRLTFGSNVQFSKNNNLLPAAADLAFSAGYKLSDKKIIGVGLSYRAGFGTVQKIKITHQGFGVRTYADIKFKKQLYISGGFEKNYQHEFNTLSQLKNYSAWQNSGLIGLSKKMNIKTKWFKGSSVQLLYDFLHKQNATPTPAILFRTGFSFK